MTTTGPMIPPKSIRANNGKVKTMKNNQLSYRLIFNVPFWIFILLILLPFQINGQQTQDKLLLALERALFPQNVSWIQIKEYPSCLDYAMNLDTNILIRIPQPDEEIILEILSQIAFTKNELLIDPIIELYERHQDNFRREWEDVLKRYKYSCNEMNRQIRIMHAFEHTLRTLKYVKDRWSCEEIWEEYQKIRVLDYRVSKKIGDYIKNTQAYPIYSEYFRDIRRLHYNWFAYEVRVRSHSPFIKCLEPFILEQCETSLNNISPKENLVIDSSWINASNMFDACLYNMSFIYSPQYEQWLMDNFGRIIELLFNLNGVFRYAQKNPHVSQRYIEFMLDQLYEHPYFDTLDYLTMEGWCNNLINRHTRQVIKPYLLAKANSTKTLERMKAFAMLVQFPEEDVLELFLSRARSRHTTEEEMEVLYNNFKRINQRIYFSDAQHDEVRKQIKRMAPNYEKNEK
jgi:hypothetical protein